MKKETKQTIDEETQFILDYLYQTTPTRMILPDGTNTEVPDSGSIGLLAAGYRGIIAWRKKREEKYGKKIFSPLNEAYSQMQKRKSGQGEPDDSKKPEK